MFPFVTPLLPAPLVCLVGMGASLDWHCPLVTWAETGRLYQTGNESRLAGRILDSRILKFMDGPSGLCLLVDAQGQRTVVVVAPLAFLESKRILLARGLRFQATGVLSAFKGVSVFIPRELNRGSQGVSLRDRWGKPLWKELPARPPPAVPSNRSK